MSGGGVATAMYWSREKRINKYGEKRERYFVPIGLNN